MDHMDIIALSTVIGMNVIFSLVFIYLKWSDYRQLDASTLILAHVCNKCRCRSSKSSSSIAAITPNRIICMRIVYRICINDNNIVFPGCYFRNQSGPNTKAKIKFLFCDENDRRLFLLPLRVNWLFDVDRYVYGNNLRNALFPNESAQYRLFRIEDTQYMIQLYYQLHDCVNYFDDMVRKKTKRKTSTSTTFRRKRQQQKRYLSNKSMSKNFDINNYRPNLNRIRKVFIQLQDTKRRLSSKFSKSKSKRKSSVKCVKKGFSSKAKMQTTGAATQIDALTLELCGEMLGDDPNQSYNNNNNNKSYSNNRNVLLKTYFAAILYRASLTEIGIFYELARQNFPLDDFVDKRFIDKFAHSLAARMSVIECAGCLHFAANLLAATTLAVTLISAPTRGTPKDTLIYVATAIASTTIVSMIYAALIYLYKSGIRRCLSRLRYDKRIYNQTIVTWMLLIVSILVAAIVIFMLRVSLPYDQSSNWLIAFTLSILFFTISAIWIWLWIAIIFNYFAKDVAVRISSKTSNNNKNNNINNNNQKKKNNNVGKNSQGFDLMVVNEYNPSYARQTLADF